MEHKSELVKNRKSNTAIWLFPSSFIFKCVICADHNCVIQLESRTVQFSPNVIFEPFVELDSDLVINNNMYSNYINSTALAILTRKTQFSTKLLLNSVQELTETETRLLLTFFLCLHNQLISIQFIVRY